MNVGAPPPVRAADCECAGSAYCDPAAPAPAAAPRARGCPHISHSLLSSSSLAYVQCLQRAESGSINHARSAGNREPQSFEL
jgi:hypothetical protein